MSDIYSWKKPHAYYASFHTWDGGTAQSWGPSGRSLSSHLSQGVTYHTGHVLGHGGETLCDKWINQRGQLDFCAPPHLWSDFHSTPFFPLLSVATLVQIYLYWIPPDLCPTTTLTLQTPSILYKRASMVWMHFCVCVNSEQQRTCGGKLVAISENNQHLC